MNIVQLTPGAGAMFCGNCFRDNALVAALRKLGHRVVMAPLYLPLTLDEEDQSAEMPIFFSGINVYLQQKSGLFRQAPTWLRNLFSSRPLLQWAAGKAAKTRAQDLGELTLSMLRGEHGNQARDLEDLIKWLATAPEEPEVICLSNALLAGFARRLKSELRVPLVCTLQGEDSFLDSLPGSDREKCWQTLAERAAEIDAFIAPSHYFAKLMSERLGLPSSRVHVVHNGIDLTGYIRPADDPKRYPSSPVLGYFARMCREKGLDQLVEAFITLRQRGRIKDLKLRIGGSCGPADESFVESLRERLKGQNLLAHVEFHPNLDRTGKLAFLQGLSVFSVPAVYSEAFGLYVIEALAAAGVTRCSLARASDNADLWSRASNASSRCLLVVKRRSHRPLRRDFQGPGLVPFALGPDQHIGIGFQGQGVGMSLGRNQHLRVGEIRKDDRTLRFHLTSSKTPPERN